MYFFTKKQGLLGNWIEMYTAYIYIYTKIIWRHSLRRYFGHKRTATIFSFRSRPDFTDRGTRAGDPFRWGECATQQCCQYCWHRKCGRRPWGLGMSFSKLVVGMVFVWKKNHHVLLWLLQCWSTLGGESFTIRPLPERWQFFFWPQSHCDSVAIAVPPTSSVQMCQGCPWHLQRQAWRTQMENWKYYWWVGICNPVSTRVTTEFCLWKVECRDSSKKVSSLSIFLG